MGIFGYAEYACLDFRFVIEDVLHLGQFVEFIRGHHEWLDF